MKKLLLTIMMILMLTGFVFAEAGPISCSKVYAGTLTAGSTAYTSRLELQRNEGYFSVQSNHTGTGVLQILYQVSNDGTNWSTAVEIVAAAATGVVYPYPATGVNIFAKYQRLAFTETGSANPVVITGVYRCVQ